MAHSLNIQSDKLCSENGRSHGQSFECCWGEIVQDDRIENKRIDVLGTPPRPGFLFATYPAGCHQNGQILRRFTPQDDKGGKEESGCVGNVPTTIELLLF